MRVLGSLAVLVLLSAPAVAAGNGGNGWTHEKQAGQVAAITGKAICYFVQNNGALTGRCSQEPGPIARGKLDTKLGKVTGTAKMLGKGLASLAKQAAVVATVIAGAALGIGKPARSPTYQAAPK